MWGRRRGGAGDGIGGEVGQGVGQEERWGRRRGGMGGELPEIYSLPFPL